MTLGHLLSTVAAVVRGEFVQEWSTVFDKACLQSRKSHSSESSPAIGQKKSLAFVFEWCFFNNNNKIKQKLKQKKKEKKWFSRGLSTSKVRCIVGNVGSPLRSCSLSQKRNSHTVLSLVWPLLLLQCFIFFCMLFFIEFAQG